MSDEHSGDDDRREFDPDLWPEGYDPELADKRAALKLWEEHVKRTLWIMRLAMFTLGVVVGWGVANVV